MTPHEMLLKEIRERQEKLTEFNQGILTADRYVKTISECVGSDLCYRFAAKGNISFQDILTKAASVLTYNNEDMQVEDVYGKAYGLKDNKGEDLELPKNTLMVFKHVLTTPRKDRDGDVMRTQGAKLDPKMLLLWQHVHTLPIGKLLLVAEHNTKRLSVYSAIVDMNELSHDAAVMVDNKMGRFSHGFKAIEFDKEKGGGFDVKSYEIMEESLVSVPSNVDANTEEIILSLVEGGKLTSVMMKNIGKSIRTRMPKQFAGGTDFKLDAGKLPLSIDLNISLNGKAINGASTSTILEAEHETKCTGGSDCGCGCGGSGAPEEAHDDGSQEKNTNDKEMMMCPHCGSRMVNGKCTKCGYILEKSVDATPSTNADEDAEKDLEEDLDEKTTSEKAGRRVNAKNLEHLQAAHDSVQEVHKNEHLMTKGGHALCEKAMGHLKEVIGSGMNDLSETSTDVLEKGGPGSGKSTHAEGSLSEFLATATKADRQKLRKKLDALDAVESMKENTQEFAELSSKGGPGSGPRPGGGGKKITSNNTSHGFFGTFSQKHGEEKAGGVFHEAASAIMSRHGTSSTIARNYLDSTHGRHVADHMLDGKNVHQAMLAVHGNEHKISKALNEIGEQTAQGYFD